jgi:two-component system sensor histidine kinase KdpD
LGHSRARYLHIGGLAVTACVGHGQHPDDLSAGYIFSGEPLRPRCVDDGFVVEHPCLRLFFGPPTFSFVISDLENIVGLAVMIVVANVTSNLLEKARLQADIARQREHRANALYRLSQALSEAQNSQAVAGIAVQHIHDDFAAEAVLLFPDANNQLHYPGAEPLRHSLRGVDLAAAQRAFE